MTRAEAKKHLSPEILAALQKAKKENLSTGELSLLAAVLDVFARSGKIEFVYLPEVEDDSEDSEECPIAWFSVNESDADNDRGTVLLHGEAKSVLDGPIVIEAVQEEAE